MKTKIFTLFLALIICTEFLQAFTVIDGINYDFNETDKTAIVHRRASYSGDIVIPDSVRFNFVYYRVIGIYDKAFQNCESLTSITIPNSILSIGEEAFSGCNGLTSVSLGNGITSIEKGVFSGCSSLTSLTLPNCVTSIGAGAFGGCGLTSFIIPNGITSIEASTFVGCSNMTSITIPNSVVSIGDYAFQGCNLASFTLPNSVTYIGRDAFQYVPIPIYNDTFFAHLPEDYSGSYRIPEGIKQLVFAFSHCINLTSVTIPNSVVYIGENAFYDCRNLTSITLPNNVTEIGSFAFCGCTGLTSVTIPNSVINIGFCCFDYCTGLKSVTLGNNVDSIGGNAFSRCKSLKTITIPNSVTSIGIKAFQNCDSLTSVTLGSNVKYIGSSAFSACSVLSSIYNYAIIPQEPEEEFYWVKTYCTLYVPTASLDLYKAANIWKEFKAILPIPAAKINDADVSAIPTDNNSVILEWPEVSGADTYIIEIKQNEEQICTLNFDANGQLVTHSYGAPSRNGEKRYVASATQIVKGWQYKLEGLDYNTQYSYTITAKNENSTLFTQTINFVTASPTAIINVDGNNVLSNHKILRNGQIFILRGDRTYTLQGQEVK